MRERRRLAALTDMTCADPPSMQNRWLEPHLRRNRASQRAHMIAADANEEKFRAKMDAGISCAGSTCLDFVGCTILVWSMTS
jgi:hypothetical protein